MFEYRPRRGDVYWFVCK